MGLRSVTGQPLAIYGERTVNYKLTPEISAKVTYVVADVPIPVVSVSRLVSQSYSAVIGTQGPYLAKDGCKQTCPVYRRGSLYYLEPISRDVPTVSAVRKPPHRTCHFHGGRSDYWELLDSQLVRHHKGLRKSLFVPTGTVDIPACTSH